MYILLLLNKPNLKKPTVELVSSDQLEFKVLVEGGICVEKHGSMRSADPSEIYYSLLGSKEQELDAVFSLSSCSFSLCF